MAPKNKKISRLPPRQAEIVMELLGHLESAKNASGRLEVAQNGILPMPSDYTEQIDGLIRSLEEYAGLRCCASCDGPMEPEAGPEDTLCGQCWKSQEKMDWIPGGHP